MNGYYIDAALSKSGLISEIVDLYYNSFMRAKAKQKLSAFWDFVRDVFRSFGEHKCSMWASSIAYFGLFSFFPMMIFLVYAGTVFLTSEAVEAQVNLFLVQMVPLYSAEIGTIIEKTLAVRGPIGLAAVIALIWSGSSVFSFLAAAMCVIWEVQPRPFWRRRLLAAVSVLVLGVLFVTAFFMGPVLRLVSNSLGIANRQVLVFFVEILLMLISSYALFRVFPNRVVYWKSALTGAAVSSGLIQVVKYVFSLYLGSAFVDYGAVYGSLAWIVSVALWVYLASLMFLLGAEVAATLEKREMLK